MSTPTSTISNEFIGCVTLLAGPTNAIASGLPLISITPVSNVQSAPGIFTSVMNFKLIVKAAIPEGVDPTTNFAHQISFSDSNQEWNCQLLTNSTEWITNNPPGVVEGSASGVIFSNPSTPNSESGIEISHWDVSCVCDATNNMTLTIEGTFNWSSTSSVQPGIFPNINLSWQNSGDLEYWKYTFNLDAYPYLTFFNPYTSTSSTETLSLVGMSTLIDPNATELDLIFPLQLLNTYQTVSFNPTFQDPVNGFGNASNITFNLSGEGNSTTISLNSSGNQTFYGVPYTLTKAELTLTTLTVTIQLETTTSLPFFYFSNSISISSGSLNLSNVTSKSASYHLYGYSAFTSDKIPLKFSSLGSMPDNNHNNIEGVLEIPTTNINILTNYPLNCPLNEEDLVFLICISTQSALNPDSISSIIPPPPNLFTINPQYEEYLYIYTQPTAPSQTENTVNFTIASTSIESASESALMYLGNHPMQLTEPQTGVVSCVSNNRNEIAFSLNPSNAFTVLRSRTLTTTIPVSYMVAAYTSLGDILFSTDPMAKTSLTQVLIGSLYDTDENMVDLNILQAAIDQNGVFTMTINTQLSNSESFVAILAKTRANLDPTVTMDMNLEITASGLSPNSTFMGYSFESSSVTVNESTITVSAQLELDSAASYEGVLFYYIGADLTIISI